MQLFSRREIKIIVVAVAVATVVAVMIALVVGTSRRARQSPGPDEGMIAGSSVPDISEIIVPEEFTLTGGERWYFSREPLLRWNEEQIREYWIDPAEIGVDLMVEHADSAIEEFIKTIP